VVRADVHQPQAQQGLCLRKMVVVAADVKYEHNVMVAMVTHIITFGRPIAAVLRKQGTYPYSFDPDATHGHISFKINSGGIHNHSKFVVLHVGEEKNSTSHLRINIV
jgi:hypothetical protein